MQNQDHRVGSRNPRAKLTEESVAAIRAEPNAPGITDRLAAQYCVSGAAIRRVRDRTTWKHVPGGTPYFNAGAGILSASTREQRLAQLIDRASRILVTWGPTGNIMGVAEALTYHTEFVEADILPYLTKEYRWNQAKQDGGTSFSK